MVNYTLITGWFIQFLHNWSCMINTSYILSFGSINHLKYMHTLYIRYSGCPQITFTVWNANGKERKNMLLSSDFCQTHVFEGFLVRIIWYYIATLLLQFNSSLFVKKVVFFPADLPKSYLSGKFKIYNSCIPSTFYIQGAQKLPV